jgi:hypothetical protein
MKILTQVIEHGKKLGVHINYSRVYLLEGEAVPVGTVVALELTGLRRKEDKAVLEWLSKHAGDNGKEKDEKRSRREIARIPAQFWRRAALDDYIDADEWQFAAWCISEQFPLTEIAAFAEQWLPVVQERTAQLIAAQGVERRKLVKSYEDVAGRVYTVAPQATARARHELEEELKAEDRRRWIEAKTSEADLVQRVQSWVKAVGTLHDEGVIREALVDVGAAIGELLKQDQPSGQLALVRLGEKNKVRNQLSWYPEFWEKIQPHLKLEPTVRGETIDVTDATEITVPLSWDLLRAGRVGPVVPGRTALAIHTSGGRVKYYIRAERKLKFRLQKAGGSIRKYGCELVMQSKEAKSLGPKLVEIERLDTLANIDPAQALGAVEDLNLPAHHPAREAAAKARSDFRQRRILADLLIEERFGIDADIARHLARSQARGNRR